MALITSLGFILTLVFGTFLPFLFQCVSIINKLSITWRSHDPEAVSFSFKSSPYLFNKFPYWYIFFIYRFHLPLLSFYFSVVYTFPLSLFQCHYFLRLLWEMLLEKERKRIICRGNIIYIGNSKELSGKLFKRLRGSSRLYIQIIIIEKILL